MGPLALLDGPTTGIFYTPVENTLRNLITKCVMAVVVLLLTLGYSEGRVMLSLFPSGGFVVMLSLVELGRVSTGLHLL